MDGHQAESAELRESRRVAVGLDRLFDDFLGHGGDELTERVDPGRPPRRSGCPSPR